MLFIVIFGTYFRSYGNAILASFAAFMEKFCFLKTSVERRFVDRSHSQEFVWRESQMGFTVWGPKRRKRGWDSWEGEPAPVFSS